jgi:hypothetical protein
MADRGPPYEADLGYAFGSKDVAAELSPLEVLPRIQQPYPLTLNRVQNLY